MTGDEMATDQRQTANAIKDALRILIETALVKNGTSQANCILAAFVEVSAELGLSCVGKAPTLRVFREATRHIQQYKTPSPPSTH